MLAEDLNLDGGSILRKETLLEDLPVLKGSRQDGSTSWPFPSNGHCPSLCFLTARAGITHNTCVIWPNTLEGKQPGFVVFFSWRTFLTYGLLTSHVTSTSNWCHGLGTPKLRTFFLPERVIYTRSMLSQTKSNKQCVYIANNTTDTTESIKYGLRLWCVHETIRCVTLCTNKQKIMPYH